MSQAWWFCFCSADQTTDVIPIDWWCQENIFLLRHNIAAKELVLLANSNAFLGKNLHDFKEINKNLNKDIVIISGDGGAFKSLPRVFCRENDKVKHIINGIGGIKEDSFLIINKNQISKYIINWI